MEPHLVYELIGYLASALVAISLMMSKIVRLRIINMLGAIAFIIYGLLINSIPVAGVNAFIVLVNIYYLSKIYASTEYFKLLQISPPDEYLKHFLDFYRDEIYEFQPGFSYQPEENDVVLMVLRDMVPAGILIGSRDESINDQLIVDLDFVIPQYRDFKIGRYLFRDKKDFFLNRGIKTVVSEPGNEKHVNYLEQMGFRRDGERYFLELVSSRES
jgi:hypothetical protein